jgi:hypothetical protein
LWVYGADFMMEEGPYKSGLGVIKITAQPETEENNRKRQ